DYRPEQAHGDKLKREQAGQTLTVPLAANPDIARETIPLRRPGSIAIGFALETSNLMANAEKKLAGKQFDLLVANDATEEGAGFEVATNRVTLLAPGHAPERLPLQSKDAVAEAILDRVEARLAGGTGRA